jgi:membrane-bound serine protease (ClpP class)
MMITKRGLAILILGGLAIFLFLTQPAAYASSETTQEGAPLVLALQADGPVSPTMQEYLSRGIRTAVRREADLIVLQLDTPGGGLEVMKRIVELIRSSPVPIVVYVAPNGAMAGSAGTLITLAGHASAMAPETIIGAASPIDLTGQDLEETVEAKEKEALKALARSLAERRSPEAVALAESTIESARAVSATEAYEAGLIDFLADDLNDLLEQLDGFTVLVNGEEQVLNTDGAEVLPLPPSLIEQVLATIANPNIVFLLIQVGVLAVLIEISSPGGWVAGFIGVVCLALAAYGLGLLPVNWFGLVFLATAFVLFLLEIKTPAHGALTAAGAASLIVGALVLFNSPGVPFSMRISPWLVVVTSLLTAAGFGVLVSFAMRVQKTPIRTGLDTYLGRVGTANTALDPRGTVRVGGEMWNAELLPGEEPLPKGARVEVVRVEGFKLFVRKIVKNLDAD